MLSYNQQQQQKCPPELLEALEKNGPLIDILKSPAVAQQLRANHEKLVERLAKRSTMIEILDIVRNSTDKALQKSILGLFQTSNLVLHRFFADDLVVMENAITRTLEEEHPAKGYAVGMIARFLNKAFDEWPDECGEVCRVSETIYPTVIRNLDRSAVFQLVCDLVSEHHKGIAIFVWHCFVSISGVKERPPPFACCEREVKVEGLGPVHCANVIELMRQFFQMRKGKDSVAKSKDPEFEEIVQHWAVKLDDARFLPLNSIL